MSLAHQPPQPPDGQADGTSPVLTLVSPEHEAPITEPTRQLPPGAPAEDSQETTTEIPAVTPDEQEGTDDEDTPRSGLREWLHDLVHSRPPSIAETRAYSREGDWAADPSQGQRTAHGLLTLLCNVVQVYGTLLTRINTPVRLLLFVAVHLITITALITTLT